VRRLDAALAVGERKAKAVSSHRTPKGPLVLLAELISLITGEQTMNKTWWRAVGLAVLLAGLAVVSWQAAGGAAEDRPGTDALPPDLARVPARSLALYSVRVADVWSSPLARGARDRLGKDLTAKIKDIETKTGLTAENVERVTIVLSGAKEPMPLFFVGTAKAFDARKIFRLAVPGGMEEKYKGETIFANEQQAGHALGEKAFVIGPKADVQSLIDAGKAKPEGGLVPALALAAKKHSWVVGLNPSVLPPEAEELPPQLEVLKPLLKATSATVAVDLGEKTTDEIRITFSGAADAGAGLKAVQAGRKMALGLLDQGIGMLHKEEKDTSAKAIAGLLETVQKSLKAARIAREGNTIVGRMDLKIDQATAGAVVADAARKVREAAARAQSQNNLKQLAIAMHNNESTTGSLPAQAIYDKDGKPLLSWRVMLLPYLDQNELYKQFKLDEAWDSPHNKKLLAKMPVTYQAPSAKPKHPHGTVYQAFVGNGAFFEGKKGIRLVDITDGTSNTIMIVEAANDVPWTKPEDLPFNPDKPLPKLGGLYSTPGFNAAICDGSVRYFSGGVKESTLKKFITRNGGEVIGPDE
jgi:hypothetical protein